MAKALEEYKAKRDFEKTDEPKGEVIQNTDASLRFVVQHHKARGDHYDLRLELDGVLKSWAIPKGPSYDPHDKRLAIQVEDHPLAYRNFEGVIPKGEYGGGTVMIWDEGFWEPYKDPHKGLEKGALKFTLYGKRLKGKWALIHIKPREGEKDVNWLLIKERDYYADSAELSQCRTSVRTHRTMEEIAASALEGTPESAVSDENEKKESVGDKETTGKLELPVSARKAHSESLVIDGVFITHPSKVLFSKLGISKGDVAEYYSAVAKRIMPYVRNRLISTVRCPKGIEGSCFFRKHPSSQYEGVGSMKVATKEGKVDTFFYLVNVQGLLHEVQLNTVEFHVWGSDIEHLENPDIMVFDLDPDEGMNLSQIRQGVRDVKSILDNMSLTAFLKTTGGKGYHVVAPFEPTSSWKEFQDFAENLAKEMEMTWPDRYTSSSRKSERKGRIYIDWQRNIRSATSVAPYSVRSRPKATVSMPITWEELETVAPGDIDMKEAIKRTAQKDPWENFFEVKQELRTNN